MIELLRAFIEAHEAALGLFILAVMFIGFVAERFPPTVVAVLGACAFLTFGILNSDDLFSVFSNEAPITIAAMFVLSGALLRTGTIDAIAGTIVARAQKRPKRAILEMMVGTYAASAFMNNTPVVIVMIPIIQRLAKAIGMSSKKLLIPLSYICILGGTTTLIGTSTNLLVSGVAHDAGMQNFTIFSITPFGLIAGATGATILMFFSRYLLPNDEPVAQQSMGDEKAGFLSEMLLLPESEYIGKRMREVPLLRRASVTVIALKRENRFRRTDIQHEPLMAGDRLVVRLTLTELLSLRGSDDFEIGVVEPGHEHIGSDAPAMVEATIAPTHPAIGSRLRGIPFLSQLNVRILGISRFRRLPTPDLAGARIQAVDRLIVTGPIEDVAQLHANPHLYGVGETSEREFRRSKAPVAIAALGAVVLLSTFGILSIGVAAILAVGVIFLTRCIDAEEAWGAIDGNVLVLIFAMLAVGVGLEKSGSVTLVVDTLVPILSSVPPWAVIVTVYVMSVLLTEIVTNNAVAIIVTPIVISLAAQLGINPEPLVIAVMFAASASFATPIGYQTNTLVYAAGGYRFTDFFKAGIPITIGVGIATCLALSIAY